VVWIRARTLADNRERRPMGGMGFERPIAGDQPTQGQTVGLCREIPPGNLIGHFSVGTRPDERHVRRMRTKCVHEGRVVEAREPDFLLLYGHRRRNFDALNQA
jgi:hypothetical protein